MRFIRLLSCGLAVAVASALLVQPEARGDEPHSVYAVATEGAHGLIDAAFGSAQAKAAEAARQTGQGAFVLDSLSGTAAIDLSERKLVVRLALMPTLSEDLLRERTTNAASNGIAEAVLSAQPPLEERVRHEATADWLWQYHAPAVVGRPSEGGVPPTIYALSYAGALPPLGDGDLHAEWIGGGGSDLEVMLEQALQSGSAAYSQGHQQIAYRVVAWSYESGGIAGQRRTQMVLEVRGIQPGGVTPLAGTAEQAVEKVRSLVAAHDWTSLAMHYDLSGGTFDMAELQSGAFFHRHLPPLDADAMGLWRYRHPFHPDAKLVGVEPTSNPAVVKATMMLEIDQGGGTPQRMLREFRMRKVDGGLLLLPD
jgi:hypothetical protein